MEFQHLQNFLIILEQKSISNAASLIRIAQPALSRQVRALEAAVGAPLLVRQRWGVTPTPAGEVLAEHARAIVQSLQAAQDAVSTITRAPGGTLAIGMTGSIASVLLPPLALAAQADMPAVRFTFSEENSHTLQQKLLSREIDFGVVHEEDPVASLVTEHLLLEPVVAAGRAGLFPAGQTISVEAIMRHPTLVAGTSDRLRLVYEEAIAATNVASGHTAGHFVEINSFPALIELLALGAGVSLLPYSAIHAGVAAGRLSWAMLAPQLLTRSLAMARHKDRQETPAWQRTAQLLRTIVAERQGLYQWLPATGQTVPDARLPIATLYAPGSPFAARR